MSTTCCTKPEVVVATESFGLWRSQCQLVANDVFSIERTFLLFANSLITYHIAFVSLERGIFPVAA